MKYLVALVVLIALWFATPAESNDTEKPHVAYVRHFLRNYPQRLEKALEVMPLLEKYSALYDFDPIVPAVIISCESSWKPKVSGTIGETGLMQVHGVCAKGKDLSTVDGMLEAGIECMSMARDACDGSLREMMTMYMSGSCHARTQRTRRVVTRRLHIIGRWQE